MSRTRFIQQDTVRLQISDGDYLDVKQRLTHGEREDFFATIAPFGTDGLSKVDRHLLRTTRVLTYLVGWSLTNNGKPVPMGPELSDAKRSDTIRSLDPETFDEIHLAIEQHIEAVDKEREASKNAQSGESKSSVISPSPSDVTGATNGSEN